MNTSKLNEINATGADAWYGARGVPAFLCHFVSKKWQQAYLNGKLLPFKG
jgi:hypothetical protein